MVYKVASAQHAAERGHLCDLLVLQKATKVDRSGDKARPISCSGIRPTPNVTRLFHNSVSVILYGALNNNFGVSF